MPRAIGHCGLLADEDPRWKSVLVRSCRYLNNIVEQDHRAIKRRCASMLGFKSFETAATTLAGIELAHRIHKQQFSFDGNRLQPRSSLKSVWDRALESSESCNASRGRFPRARPPMHQNSNVKVRRKAVASKTSLRRYARKIFDGRGLYTLVMPNGSQYWRYNYRFRGKYNTLALGLRPDVSLEEARARHQVARSMLANGIDPSARKRAVGEEGLRDSVTLVVARDYSCVASPPATGSAPRIKTSKLVGSIGFVR